jgi:hypothetical protein
MSGVIPVKIVTLGDPTASQVQPLADMGNLRLRIIDSDAKAANVSGGVVPMTQAEYDAMIAAGSVAA